MLILNNQSFRVTPFEIKLRAYCANDMLLSTIAFAGGVMQSA